MKSKIYLLLLLLSCSSALFAQDVVVVAHRADWRNYPENSLEAVQGAIDMGVDMIEIDLAMSKDGVLVLMHDKSIDRTTTGKGKPSDYTLKELKALRLRNGQGRNSEVFTIPTLEEVMRVAKGNIRVNLDKADKYFDEVYKILIKTKTLDQVVIKSSEPYSELLETFGPKLKEMTFMPVVHIKESTRFEDLRPVLSQGYSTYELVFSKENKKLMQKIRKELDVRGSQIWINAMWNSLCGGYTDNKSTVDADKNWGYLLDTLGARVIQTDRPEQLIEYLKSRGQHK